MTLPKANNKTGTHEMITRSKAIQDYMPEGAAEPSMTETLGGNRTSEDAQVTASVHTARTEVGERTL